MALTNIYPQDFFNIEHPGSPYVNIQFRTQINENDDIKSSKHWEEITYNPNNFFNSVRITDRGGVQEVELNLKDKNFAKLETTIIKALLATRISNKLVKDPDHKTDDTGYFEFVVDRGSSVNLRIRFGYSAWAENYIDASDINSDDYKRRVEEKKPVIRSPWIYLQIIDTEFDVRPDGLEVRIKAFSSTSTFLDRAKMVQKFAKLRGEPHIILQNIRKIVEEASSGKMTLEYEDDPPQKYINRDGTGEIEIMLGGEPTWQTLEDGSKKIVTQYQSLRTLLEEFCSKVAPALYKKDGTKLTISSDANEDGTGLDNNSEEIDQIMKYSYMVEERDDKTVIRFFYEDKRAQVEKQENIRVYSWIENGHSIVKDLRLKSKTDFAQLNLPIVTIGSDGTVNEYVAQGKEFEEGNKADEIDFRLGSIKNLKDAINKEEFSATFVSDIKHTDDFEVEGTVSANMAASRMIRKLVENINATVFDGTIEIPGDPYYLFDSSIRPAVYLIKIIVKRPTYYEDGEVKGGEKSYLSGIYALTEIEHEISTSGFTTKLQVLRWPMPDIEL